jgi:hypothetical protein
MGSIAQAAGIGRLGVPTYLDDQAQWLRLLANSVNGMLQGKTLNIGTVTLTANSATTAMTDSRIGPKSFIGFMPQTANAAGAVSGLYVTARGDGVCTLNHANNAQSDKTFTYVVIG